MYPKYERLSTRTVCIVDNSFSSIACHDTLTEACHTLAKTVGLDLDADNPQVPSEEQTRYAANLKDKQVVWAPAGAAGGTLWELGMTQVGKRKHY
jgi:hypothetical protein